MQFKRRIRKGISISLKSDWKRIRPSLIFICSSNQNFFLVLLSSHFIFLYSKKKKKSQILHILLCILLKKKKIHPSFCCELSFSQFGFTLSLKSSWKRRRPFLSFFLWIKISLQFFVVIRSFYFPEVSFTLALKKKKKKLSP